MEASKQKAIELAYGEHWEVVKEFVDNNGKFKHDDFDCMADEKKNNWEYVGNQMWRPKSLQGIETNNGWIKIESEADLPKDVIACWVKTKEYIVNTPVLYDVYNKKFTDGKVEQIYTFFTHYQPIQEPQPPIY